jgi:hypothetical protein
MASLIAYTKKQLVERIKRHIANGWPTSTFSASDFEVLLYIDQAAAFTVVGQMYNMAKVEGNLATPEAWLTTYTLSTLSNDAPSGYWYSTLPQPPVSLPLGYSINRVYAAEAGSGQSQELLPIKAKRVGYRKNMPLPGGARYWVTGSKIWMGMSDGSSMLDYTVYVEMIKTRTESLTETLNLPDDAIEAIFQNVVGKLIQRMQLPKDVVTDDLPSGATNISK